MPLNACCYIFSLCCSGRLEVADYSSFLASDHGLHPWRNESEEWFLVQRLWSFTWWWKCWCFSIFWKVRACVCFFCSLLVSVYYESLEMCYFLWLICHTPKLKGSHSHEKLFMLNSGINLQKIHFFIHNKWLVIHYACHSLGTLFWFVLAFFY